MNLGRSLALNFAGMMEWDKPQYPALCSEDNHLTGNF